MKRKINKSETINLTIHAGKSWRKRFLSNNHWKDIVTGRMCKSVYAQIILHIKQLLWGGSYTDQDMNVMDVLFTYL